MGFPTWTLWGMGAAGLGALLFTGLALAGQSSRLMGRLSSRVQAFTAYGFASVLLAFAFFLAGVPMGEQTAVGEVIVVTATPTITPPGNGAAIAETTAVSSAEPPSSRPTSATPQTGAFGGAPPSSQEDETPTNDAADDATDDAPSATATAPVIEATAVSTAAPSTTPVAATATPTTAPTQTPSPMPTLTPTPIFGETAVISVQGGSVWMQRLPGNQDLLMLTDGDIVILRAGHANRDGDIWRQVTAVGGVDGWVQESWIVEEDG